MSYSILQYTLTADDIRTCLSIKEEPSILIVCGSGLSSIADGLTDVNKVFYKEIPGFPLVNNTYHSLFYGQMGGVFVGKMPNFKIHAKRCSASSARRVPNDFLQGQRIAFH